MRTIFKSLLFALFLGLFSMGKAYALDVSSFLSSSVYENEKTGYTAYIDDEEACSKINSFDGIRQCGLSFRTWGK